MSLMVPATVLANASSVVVSNSATVVSNSPSSTLVTSALQAKMVERAKEIYPELFEHGDYRINYVDSRTYPRETKTRYHISIDFNNSEIYSNFEFVGEELELNSFNVHRRDNSAAVFPPKISRDEAEQIALKYIERFTSLVEFDIEANNYRYPRSVTEPIEYTFMIIPKHEGIRISRVNYQVSVLADGFVSRFYQGMAELHQSYTFANAEDLLSEDDIRALLAENLTLELSYMNHQQQQNQGEIKLIYRAKNGQDTIQAKSGDFINLYPMPEVLEGELKPLSETPLDVKKTLTEAEIEQLALKLLAINSEQFELRINRINKETNYQGQEVYRVDYTYSYRNGSTGSSIEILENGEIMNFYRHFPYYDPWQEQEHEVNLSEDQAFDKALEFIKTYAGSIYHELAHPLYGTSYDEYSNSYNFSFPRHYQGVPFSHDSVSVNISAEDGAIVNFYRNYTQIDSTVPEISSAQAITEIMEKYIAGLKLDLVYDREHESNHYELVYRIYPDPPAQFNAVTAQWEKVTSPYDLPGGESLGVSHPWAEQELNFLIETGAIAVAPDTDFDAAISVGEGLEVLIKSMGRFWPGYYGPYGYGERRPSFAHIDEEHPLFEVVEFAVQSNILSKDEKLDLDAPLTREQFAVWVIRFLDREDVAKKPEFLQANYKDSGKISAQLLGYVVLADAYGILTSSDGYIHPKRELSLAQLSVATLRLGAALNERRRY